MTRLVWLFRAALLLPGLAAALTPPDALAPSSQGPEQGYLLLSGGVSELPRFIKMAGGANANIVVIPTGRITKPADFASLPPYCARDFAGMHCTVLHTTDRTVADSESFVAPLKQATGVWLLGGRPWRIVDPYLGTRTQQALAGVLERGGVIYGQAGAAAALASYLIRGSSQPDDNTIMMAPGHETGLGFFANAAVDMIVDTAGRGYDLAPVIKAHPDLLGIGLDEDTSVTVHGEILTVNGPLRAAVWDGKDHDGRPYYYLHPGDTLTTLTRVATSAGPADLDAEVAAFVDSRMSALDKKQGAGGVIIIVRNGAVRFAKGYGLADIANHRPMSADSTLVGPGSISKLFTGIAVMQLVEQGKLDLDRDVNAYLDFHVPTPEGGVPVTLRRLMTHRAGFEEHAKDYLSGGVPLALGPYLARALPYRLFPSGNVSAYSNYGMSLAGYIVERVSGEPYVDYIHNHILQPLRMDRSTFQRVLPAPLAQMMAQGYLSPAERLYVALRTSSMVPAGGLSSTGLDMGRFMLALLGHGQLDGAQILSPQTLTQMLAPQVTTPLGSVGLVFMEGAVAGHRLVGHGGDLTAFHSDLDLLPDDGIGIFQSYNHDHSHAQSEILVHSIVQHYLGIEPPGGPAAAPPFDASALTGTYQSTRRGESSFVKLGILRGQMIVRTDASGALTIGGVFGAAGPPLRQSAPLVFTEPGYGKFSFVQQPGEAHPRLEIGVPLVEFLHVPWYLDARFVLAMVLAVVTVEVLSLLLWPAAALLRRWRGGQGAMNPTQKARYRLIRIVLALQLALLLVIVLLFSSDDPDLLDKLDPWLLSFYAVAWLAVLGTIPVCWVACRFWIERSGGLLLRIHHTVIAAAAIVFAWFCINWHLAGTTLNY
jgi:CubicO group peptidase (beta-lactamase class C family)/cyanophycinase-like exopeptidase